MTKLENCSEHGTFVGVFLRTTNDLDAFRGGYNYTQSVYYYRIPPLTILLPLGILIPPGLGPSMLTRGVCGLIDSFITSYRKDESFGRA